MSIYSVRMVANRPYDLGETVSENQSSTTITKQENLLAANRQLSLANGIYQDTKTQIRDSKLSSYLQGAVNDSLDHAQDHSLYSTDIEKLLLTDELRSAFSPAPVNFLLSLNLSGIGKTLDLCQDFGGITHYLASRVEAIDCIRIDIGQARLSAKRCSAFNNINYLSHDISELNFPVNHYDLIIISQLESLELDKPEQAILLEKLQASLTPAGRLLVSVKNSDRLNKWMSPGTDSIKYKDLYIEEPHSSYSLQDINHSMTKSGFKACANYASFSNPNGIQHLFSQSYLDDQAHCLNHFYRLGSIEQADLSEYLLFKNIIDKGDSPFSLASRFVIIAGASQEAANSLCDIEFAHYPGLGRQAQWRATTQLIKSKNQVIKTRLHPNFGISPDLDEQSFKLSQVVEPQIFRAGPLLLDQWLSALLHENPAASFKQQVTIYAQWLKECAQHADFCSWAYDALPFNIIINQEGNFQTIDPEWQIDAQFDADFVLFRALFWFAFENKALVKTVAKHSGASTIGLFVLQHLERFDDVNELAPYVRIEEEIQAQIGKNFRNKSVEYALLQTFDGEPVPERLVPACQISWSDEAGIVDEHQSEFLLWKASTSDQWLKSSAPTPIEGKRILRIDPIATMGIFKFSSISLLTQDDTVLWSLNCTADIISHGELLNVSPINREVNGKQIETCHFVALNDDPHFLFNLNDIPNLESVNKLVVCFSLVHNQYYDNTLATLSHALSEQNRALSQQISVLDSKQADIEYLSSKLENIDQHRQALQASLHETNTAYQHQVNELNQSLQAQITHNQQLESNLVVKVVLKFKRVLARIFKS